MFPCVGIDTTEEGVGLEFVINFGSSKDHPFKYTAFTPNYATGMDEGETKKVAKGAVL